jgi:hypothetical protein
MHILTLKILTVHGTSNMTQVQEKKLILFNAEEKFETFMKQIQMKFKVSIL